MSYRPGIIRCVALATLVFASGVSAQSDKRLYVSPMASYLLADKERGTDNGYGLSLSVGKKMAQGLNLEITGFFLQAEGDGTACVGAPAGNGCDAGRKAELKGVGIGAMVFPLTVLPDLYGTVKVSVGQAEKHPGSVASYTSTIYDAGIGYLVPLSWVGIDFDLRAEAVYRLDAHNKPRTGQFTAADKQFGESVFSVGALIPLGAATPDPEEAEEPVEVVQPQAADSDGDGVPDDIDQCPGTVAGAVVDEKGCEKDSDGDGVVDRLDKCPGTPPGTKVDEVGCPLPPPPVDTGCRSPKPGEPVDFNGCAIGDAIVLRGVNFNYDKYDLTVNAKVILDQVADALIAANTIKVEIGGHTDSKGSDAYNLKLSERRAKSVMDYLTARGVDAGRMTSKGYGESQPIDTNETDEGREVNRRVEMKIVQ
ncbi:MAG: OmpA family protein [Pseudomonadota bacterium]